MKWIRYLVPLVLIAVTSTAYGQWFAATGRYTPTASAGLSGSTFSRPYRLIVAEDPAPVAAGQRTMVSSDPGMPDDDCGCYGSWGYSGGRHCGHCKVKKHCCAARASCCAPVSCGCAAPPTCGDAGACCGTRHKWLHCCKHHGYGKCGGWGWGGSGCCNCAMDYSNGAPMPQPEPAGEPIETPRQTPTSTTSAPAAKSAIRGTTWPTWNMPVRSSPQPTRARLPTYEYQVR